MRSIWRTRRAEPDRGGDPRSGRAPLPGRGPLSARGPLPGGEPGPGPDSGREPNGARPLDRVRALNSTRPPDGARLAQDTRPKSDARPVARPGSGTAQAARPGTGGPDRELVRDIALVCLADGLVGLSFGAIAVGLGLPLWLPVLLSVVVFAGASQFLFIGIVGAGGNPVAAVAAGLLVNARHVPFGFAVGDVLGAGRLRRIAGSHLMVDETVAFTLAQREPRRRGFAYWACGAGLFTTWNLGVVAGVYGGRAVGDTDALGLDAAFPAVLLALLMPSLNDSGTRRAAVAGAAIALCATPFLPAGTPVLLALAGVAAGLRGGPAARTRRQGRGQGRDQDRGRGQDRDRDQGTNDGEERV